MSIRCYVIFLSNFGHNIKYVNFTNDRKKREEEFSRVLFRNVTSFQ